MSMEELELRLLEQQHLRKMLLLQKQRLLLGKENVVPKVRVEDEKASRLPSAPYFKEDPPLEKMIYQGYLPSNQKPRIKFLPQQIDAKIAQQQIKNILGFWNCQTKMQTQDPILKIIRNKSRQIAFDKELSQVGREQIHQIMNERRRIHQSNVPVSLREKYQPRLPQSSIKNLYRGDH